MGSSLIVVVRVLLELREFVCAVGRVRVVCRAPRVRPNGHVIDVVLEGLVVVGLVRARERTTQALRADRGPRSRS